MRTPTIEGVTRKVEKLERQVSKLESKKAELTEAKAVLERLTSPENIAAMRERQAKATAEAARLESLLSDLEESETAPESPEESTDF